MHGGKNADMRLCFMHWESAKQGNIKYVNIRDPDNERKGKPNREKNAGDRWQTTKERWKRRKKSPAWWF